MKEYNLKNSLNRIVKDLEKNGFNIKKDADNNRMISVQRELADHMYSCGFIHVHKKSDNISFQFNPGIPFYRYELLRIISKYIKE